MKQIIQQLRISILALVVMTVLVSGVYPLVVWGISQVAFSRQANGSLLRDKNSVVCGSALIGQRFDDAKYFHPRPSAAGDGYDAMSSGGSNLGPLSQKLADQVRERVEKYRTENGLAANAPVPADAVTASASGLDPQISTANAEIQAERVALVRGLQPDMVKRLIAEHTQERTLGMLGEAGVNVLELNIALDKVQP